MKDDSDSNEGHVDPEVSGRPCNSVHKAILRFLFPLAFLAIGWRYSDKEGVKGEYESFKSPEVARFFEQTFTQVLKPELLLLR